MQRGCLSDHPLEDAGVLPSGGDQVTVVVEKGNVGHMAAVATIGMAWGPWLGAGVGEQVHFAKVISRGQQGGVM